MVVPFPSIGLPVRQSYVQLFFVTLLGLICSAAVYCQTTVTGGDTGADGPALTVDGTSSGDVFGMGQSVLVLGTVRKGVISFGGNVVVVGNVEGDVAAFGGSVVQKEGSFIGGDVIVVGGSYRNAAGDVGRNRAAATVMFAGYEREVRALMRDPAIILAPALSRMYLGQRLLAACFWFLTSVLIGTLLPNSVSRAVMRLQLANLHVAIFGFAAIVVGIAGVTLVVNFFPVTLGVLTLLLTFFALAVTYLFGRVAIHAATGRWLLRMLFPQKKRSESVALLFGSGFWTLVLSIPYIWPLAISGLIVTSLGLVFAGANKLTLPDPVQ